MFRGAVTFALTYKQAFDFLKFAHLIPDDRQVALRGRLQRLQKLGFPKGTNTGKGRAAQYGPEQLVWLAVAFELLEIGLTPERAANVVQRNADRIREATGAAVKTQFDGDKGTVMLVLDPEALFVPDSPQSLGDAAVVTFKYLHSSDLAEIFKSLRPGQFKRLALIDHTRVVALLAQWSHEQEIASVGEALTHFSVWADWRNAP